MHPAINVPTEVWQGLQIGGSAVKTSASGGGVEAGGGASGIHSMGRIGNVWKSRVSDKVEGLNDSFAQKKPGSKT